VATWVFLKWDRLVKELKASTPKKGEKRARSLVLGTDLPRKGNRRGQKGGPVTDKGAGTPIQKRTSDGRGRVRERGGRPL